MKKLFVNESKSGSFLDLPKLEDHIAPSFFKAVFFATDRQMNDQVNCLDGFYNFDAWLEILRKFGKKSFNFQIWRQKLKMFFLRKTRSSDFKLSVD